MLNYLLAVFAPFIVFIKRDQMIKAMIALGLQLTGALWFVATIWAFFGARHLNKIKGYEEKLDELARNTD